MHSGNFSMYMFIVCVSYDWSDFNINTSVIMYRMKLKYVTDFIVVHIIVLAGKFINCISIIAAMKVVCECIMS